MRIVEDDLTGAAVTGLLRHHLEQMHLNSPPGSVFAFDIDRLRAADVTFFSAWHGDELAGCGAIKHLDDGHGELKSMRAAPAYRGKGVGKAVLLHLLAVARARGYARVSLETGSTAPFQPARGLYAAQGFAECGPFGDYAEDPFSLFMTRVP